MSNSNQNFPEREGDFFSEQRKAQQYERQLFNDDIERDQIDSRYVSDQRNPEIAKADENRNYYHNSNFGNNPSANNTTLDYGQRSDATMSQNQYSNYNNYNVHNEQPSYSNLQNQAGSYSQQNSGRQTKPLTYLGTGLQGATAVPAWKQVLGEILGWFIVGFLALTISGIIVALAVPDFSPSDVSQAVEEKIIGIFFLTYSIIFIVLFFALSALLHQQGKTIGGLLFSYNTVEVDNGKNPQWSKAFGYTLLTSIFALGWFVAFPLMFLAFLVLFLSPLYDQKSGWGQGILQKLFKLARVDSHFGVIQRR